MKDITFRWSIWNDEQLDYLGLMLKKSISSFKKYFPEARYIVTSLNPIDVDAEVLTSKNAIFDINVLDPQVCGFALFRKFSPRFKLTDGIEFFCDLDVFCVRFPRCIPEFIDSNKKALIQCRTQGDLSDRSGFGTWNERIDPKVPPSCSGFIGMKPGYDITDRLMNLFYTAIQSNGYFEEQGAVVKAMEADILSGDVFMADEKYIQYYTANEAREGLEFDTDMLHCISSIKTNFRAFKILEEKGLISLES